MDMCYTILQPLSPSAKTSVCMARLIACTHNKMADENFTTICWKFQDSKNLLVRVFL